MMFQILSKDNDRYSRSVLIFKTILSSSHKMINDLHICNHRSVFSLCAGILIFIFKIILSTILRYHKSITEPY